MRVALLVLLLGLAGCAGAGPADCAVDAPRDAFACAHEQATIDGRTVTAEVAFWVDCTPSPGAPLSANRTWMGSVHVAADGALEGGVHADAAWLAGPGWSARVQLAAQTGGQDDTRDYRFDTPTALGAAHCGDQPEGVRAAVRIVPASGPAQYALDPAVAFGTAV